MSDLTDDHSEKVIQRLAEAIDHSLELNDMQDVGFVLILAELGSSPTQVRTTASVDEESRRILLNSAAAYHTPTEGGTQ